MVAHVVRAMRPHQWVKNLFVLAPLVFAKQALVLGHFMGAALAFAVFSVLSGCVYILNDIVDVENDRLHPSKRHRPIAAGRLPIAAARTARAILLMGSAVASVAFLPMSFAALGLSYFALNVAYSFALKHVPFVDVACIATGFLIRIIAGAFAINVPITVWILICTFWLALFLALGKRKHEILQAGHKKSEQRRVLARYRLAHVRVTMLACAALTAVSYVSFTILGEETGFKPSQLVWTIPCVLFGLFRFHQLTERVGDGRSPTDLMLSDKPFIANLVLWSAIVVAVIYAHGWPSGRSWGSGRAPPTGV